jgi:hypothetical protein
MDKRKAISEACMMWDNSAGDVDAVLGVLAAAGYTIVKADARRIQAISDGLRREPRPMLDAAETLFLGGGDHLSIAQKAGGRVAVECVDAEDVGHSDWAGTASYLGATGTGQSH